METSKPLSTSIHQHNVLTEEHTTYRAREAHAFRDDCCHLANLHIHQSALSQCWFCGMVRISGTEGLFCSATVIGRGDAPSALLNSRQLEN